MALISLCFLQIRGWPMQFFYLEGGDGSLMLPGWKKSEVAGCCRNHRFIHSERQMNTKRCFCNSERVCVCVSVCVVCPSV